MKPSNPFPKICFPLFGQTTEFQGISRGVPSVVQRNISKHSLNKPTTNGNGDTSAILTDIKGFREVLDLSLIFHALVHEYHQLPAVWQNDLDNLKEKMDTLMTSILTKIYRGDDGIDAATCKCHSHYHIIDDIRYFGDPMGYNASTGECNLKWWAKRISKAARKCGQTIFLEQTSKRVLDQLVLQRAYAAMMIDENKTSRNQYTGQGGPWF
jgi:hypothetical protein